ncbi:hypothetical protein T492DRAFT_1010740 [Pavlovales sp. CCMP2436]|nr:hypothetical protein T492DRAFT_1010740 [Pavlovales sp. CCMP2436]|mmetsp:Transcript_41251/g.102259  ORF Transcript_41251/g.102259 Transcript_41251/m.102259 type:complete len:257 (-) Transcript_41251:282-1052(-)
MMLALCASALGFSKPLACPQPHVLGFSRPVAACAKVRIAESSTDLGFSRPIAGPRAQVRLAEPSTEAPPAVAAAAFDVRNITAAIEPLIAKIAQYRTQIFDEAEATERRAEIIELYQTIFVPAAGFAVANVGVYLFVVGGVYGVLQLSGTGFETARDWLYSVTESQPWVAELVGKANPKLGNLALGLVAAELVAPLIVIASLSLSSPATAFLRGFLAANGLDAQGASKKLEGVLNRGKLEGVLSRSKGKDISDLSD